MYSNLKNYENIYNCLRVIQQNKNRKLFSDNYLVADVLKSTTLLFLFIGQVSEKRFQEAMDDVIKQNNKVDQDHYTEAVWHFNGEKISEGEHHRKLS